MPPPAATREPARMRVSGSLTRATRLSPQARIACLWRGPRLPSRAAPSPAFVGAGTSAVLPSHDVRIAPVSANGVRTPHVRRGRVGSALMTGAQPGWASGGGLAIGHAGQGGNARRSCSTYASKDAPRRRGQLLLVQLDRAIDVGELFCSSRGEHSRPFRAMPGKILAGVLAVNRAAFGLAYLLRRSRHGRAGSVARTSPAHG
jgi:hypothetical protein